MEQVRLEGSLLMDQGELPFRRPCTRAHSEPWRSAPTVPHAARAPGAPALGSPQFPRSRTWLPRGETATNPVSRMSGGRRNPTKETVGRSGTGSDFGGDRAVREASRGRSGDPAKGTGPPPTAMRASEKAPGAREARQGDPVTTGSRGAG